MNTAYKVKRISSVKGTEKVLVNVIGIQNNVSNISENIRVEVAQVNYKVVGIEA